MPLNSPFFGVGYDILLNASYDRLTSDECLFTKTYNTCSLVFLRELEVFVKLLSVLDKGNE